MPGPKETKCGAVVTLDKFTLTVIDHMLDHLCLKARVVTAALLHLAVDNLVKGNLALDIARGLGDLLVRQAALLHLAGAQAKHQTLAARQPASSSDLMVSIRSRATDSSSTVATSQRWDRIASSWQSSLIIRSSIGVVVTA